MSKSRRPTLEHRPVVTVVVIGGPQALLQATERAAKTAAKADVCTSSVPNAATTVAEQRPFAIVISEELYGFDQTEFDALARDVGASLIVLPTLDADPDLLTERLMPLVTQAYHDFFA